MHWLRDFPPSITVIPRAPLRAFTTFHLGGACRALVFCETAVQVGQAVECLAEADEPFLLIGGGSNLLVSDVGLDCVVIRFATQQFDVQCEGMDLIVGAGTPLDDVAHFAVRAGLDGLLFATGIPGTVGGAVAGNAGAFGEQMADRVLSLDLVGRDGRRREATRDDLDFSYRASSLQQTGDIVLAARLRLKRGDRPRLLSERRRILSLRREKHPDWRVLPTAGSFFKNIEPTSAAGRRQAAGWFLEQAGAKSMRVGGARVFEKHANIIVADPAGCRAADVRQLSQRMAAAVHEKFGLDLVPEVRLLGPFA